MAKKYTRPIPTDPDQSENGRKQLEYGRNFESHKKQFSFVFYTLLLRSDMSEKVGIGWNPWSEMSGALMGVT